ncbi:uncharacterized protein C6orf132 homolog [Drosophila obscura]|uniref:uncharacterized protein C6orf132 homolog n=1 Tax=Drosophila obscura TaxID=7282 RepID=UPI001BB2CC88|nr:uncharacterized protein C6orf132 homolog [Drosophila obscura]
MSTTIRVALLCFLLHLVGAAAAADTSGQQLLLARPQRSSLFAESPPLDPFASFGSIGHLAASSPGWNSVTPIGGEWAYNPIGLGHMSKDELVTLLEAWREVEQEAATSPAPEETTTKPAPPPPPPPTVRPRPPLPPPPPPPPRPVVLAPAPNPLPPGTPVTVRLPAFVPVRLAAMFTPPAAVAPAAAAAAPGDDLLVTDNQPDDDAMPRLFRFMQITPSARRQQQQQFVVRNTLDSIEAGSSPGARNRVKPSPRAVPQLEPQLAPQSAPQLAPVSAFRPRFGMPSHLFNSRLELVPSSQIIGDWRE